MRSLILFCLVFAHLSLHSQHTFSIVAVDSDTGEIGSAGATCGDSIIWPGTPGAYLISDVIPGVGAIHTQAWYLPGNQHNARVRMENGMAPADILDYLINNDVQNDSSRRQYGLIDFNNGDPRAVAFTGSGADDYKDHKTGAHYAIQGNILLGPEILDSMETRFLNTTGCLADRLMAAMQGANVPGADTRCLGEGVSSLSAFLRVAQSDDAADALSLDINVAGTGLGVEPIDVLQQKYDSWKAINDDDCLVSKVEESQTADDQLVISPNPIKDELRVAINDLDIDQLLITNMTGRLLLDVLWQTSKVRRTSICQNIAQELILLLHLKRGR